MHVKATGDIHIDDHHTNEDVALAIGTVLEKHYIICFCYSYGFSSGMLNS